MRWLLAGLLAVGAAAPSLAQPGDDVLQTHAVPDDRRTAVEAWRSELPEEVRSVWDERTGRLLLFAPLETHGDLLRVLAAPAPAPAPKPAPAPIAPPQPAAPPAQPEAAPTADGPLRLRRLTPSELHQRIERLAKRPLPATWSADRSQLTFPAPFGGARATRIRVRAADGAVTIDGDPESAAAWRDVIAAIESSQAPPDPNSADRRGAVRVVSTANASPGRVRSALQAIQASDTAAVADSPDEQAEGRPAPAQQPSAAGVAQDESILGPVRIEFVEGLDVIVLRGDQEDVERVMQIIDQIERLSAETTPEIRVRRLDHVDADSLARLLSEVYEEALGPRVGDLSVTGLAKPNALLLIGRAENVRLALGLVDQLDQPVEPANQFEVYPLENASAGAVKALIDEYFEQQVEAGGEEAASLLRSRAFVVADVRNNLVIVSAAPRDQREVASLIQQVDAARGAAVDEVRVFPLRNARAEELAELLQSAINPAEGDDDPEGPGARSAALRVGALDGSSLESGVLSGVRVAPDTRGNALVVTAPPSAMALIEALVRRLDVAPDAEAELKVFEIANGDAEALAAMLNSLFGADEDSDEPGGYGSRGLAPLTVTVDPRTNSIIAAGTAEDLAVVEAILLRLDDAEVGVRRTTVFRLRNAQALEVAQVLNEWLETERAAEADAGLAISPRELINREVVVVPESATNSLIVSATPRYEDELRRLIEQLDQRPPMVMIQVLIAEVGLNDTDEFGVELGLQDSLLFDRSLLSEIERITTTINEQSPGGATVSTTTESVISSDLAPGFNFNNQPLGNNGSDRAFERAGNVGAQGLSNFALGRVNSDLNFGGFVFSASSGNVSALLRALQENRRLEVLSRPQIMTLDGRPGEIQVGARVPRITSVNQTNFGSQVFPVEYEPVGIILQVTPRISPDGQVVMNVFAEKSEVGEEEDGVAINVSPTGEVIRAPQIATTTARTTVSAASGQTIVLSGLLTKRTFDVHRRVPLLSNIPLLGDLFRYDAVEQTRSELLVILTPRVVRSEVDAEMLKQVESSRMSWVLSDVIELHGPSGLRTRGDAWNEADACYPTHVPSEVELLSPTAEPAPPEVDPLPAPGAPPTVEQPAFVSPVRSASYQQADRPPRRLPATAASY
ncbi:secretin N-terminal domain-containing protein [Botrimarina sp.]|uniref:secretin N-terminal domain-containing protein n=1 Tax=Botrimarina sp. TaxID=2795802 RepID=UPI0032EB2BE3